MASDDLNETTKSFDRYNKALLIAEEEYKKKDWCLRIKLRCLPLFALKVSFCPDKNTRRRIN